MIWEHVKGNIVFAPHGCIVFDDSVLDKTHSQQIELVRRQYSGNVHGLIKGIGMINCLYVNPDCGQYWIIDYRLFDPQSDGKSKLEHVRDMLESLVQIKLVPFDRVLMDSWYAVKKLLLLIESLGKVYCCPLKANRQVNDSGGVCEYCRVDALDWTADEMAHGKLIKLRGFPKDHKAKLLRVVASINRTDFVVTNDLRQNSTQVAQEACALRWKIEQLHRELKPTTGIERCQCRKARIQRNHIACAALVWIAMTRWVRSWNMNIYQLNKSLWSDYLRQEPRSPSVRLEGVFA